MTRKSHVVLHFDCLDPRNAMPPLMMLLALHMWIPAPVVSYDQNHDVAPHFNCLDVRNAMVPLATPSTSCNTNTHANGQKSDVPSYFNCLDLMNAVVPFLFLSRWQYLNVNSSLIDWHKMSITQEWFFFLSHAMHVWNWHENTIFQRIWVCHKSFASVCY